MELTEKIREWRNKTDKLNALDRLSMKKILHYEVYSHWLAPYIGFEWGQDLIASYISWKTERKYYRYLRTEINIIFTELGNTK
jgi:hypothetical protein